MSWNMIWRCIRHRALSTRSIIQAGLRILRKIAYEQMMLPRLLYTTEEPTYTFKLEFVYYWRLSLSLSHPSPYPRINMYHVSKSEMPK